MIVAVADTHTLLWYLASDSRLSLDAKRFIDNAAQESNIIAFSAISWIEIVYLIEKGRIPAQWFSVLADALNDPKGIYQEIPIDLVIARVFTRVSSLSIPEMGDRLIAATALKLDVPLITRDHKIQQSNIQTIW